MLRATDFNKTLLVGMSYLFAPNRAKKTIKIKKIRFAEVPGYVVDNINIQNDWINIGAMLKSSMQKNVEQ